MDACIYFSLFVSFSSITRSTRFPFSLSLPLSSLSFLFSLYLQLHFYLVLALVLALALSHFLFPALSLALSTSPPPATLLPLLHPLSSISIFSLQPSKIPTFQRNNLETYCKYGC